MSIIDDKWEILFDKLNIDQEIKKYGRYYISADQIREFKEPRLMTKFDTKESMPKVFGDKYAILPVTRGQYVIGEFKLYEEFPDNKVAITRMNNAKIPDYFETIDLNDIRSESAALNILGIAGILEDFLDEPNLFQTVSGRMGSGSFSFQVSNGNYMKRQLIDVKNSQLEIDAGFENINVFSILEAKNVVHSNFLIRQLYYPQRLWSSKIKKPIRPVFMVYSNNIFRLLEYEFTDLYYYNSIRLVQEKNYSLEDIDISFDDLYRVYQETQVKPEPDVTFIQADSFTKVISLVENLSDQAMSTGEIAEMFGFKERQSDYYYNACKYLNLVQKKKDEQGNIKVYLTEQGGKLNQLSYKKRQLSYVKLILEHKIFNQLFKYVLNNRNLPDREHIQSEMSELKLCSQNLIKRRSSSVMGWLKWMVQLIHQ